MLHGFVPWPAETAARYRRDGYWQGLTLGDALRGWADAFGDRTALVSGDQRLSYRELDAAVDRLAAHLLAMGLEPEERVVLHLPNVPEFLVLAFALFRIGTLPVFAFPAHRELEIRYLCEFSEAVAYAVPEAFGRFDYLALARTMQDANPTLRHILVAGRAPGEGGLVGLTDLLARRAPADTRAALERMRPDPSQAALFLLSGGTTGVPKLIPRTHDDYVYNYRRAAEVCGFDRETVYLVALPIAHNFPFGCPGVLGTWNGGGTVILARDPSPATAFPVIERERVTAAALVPAAALRWLDAPERNDYDVSSLDLLQVGGSRLSPEIARRMQPALGCTLQQVFGMAEGLLNYTRLDDPEEVIIESQGIPMSPADEIRIVAEDDQVVDAGSPGELLTRGPYTIRGYYRAEEHNARAFTPDGFYRTGDIVRQLPTGHLVVEGRTKDLINRGGEKISAEEIENLILGHAKVANVAAVAMPDATMGERTCAYVVLRDGENLTLDDLIAFLRDTGVASYKLPERLECVEGLPLTNVGKVNKRALREDIAARLQTEETAQPTQGVEGSS